MNNFDQKLDSIALDLKELEFDMSKSGSTLDDIEVKMNNLTTALEGGKKNWTGDEVRSTFIDFFVKKKNHTFWPSSPVVPVNDPTLLFANAGMNQYKPLFLGTATPGEEMSSLKRAVNSQKCIRAGGKHNDLDDVGKDVYHHTFFEMLGNWSFGDFFKEEAIAWCWELLVNVYGLDPDRLYASYFKGDPEKGLACDDEAKNIWLKYLPEERVLGFDCGDNFWEMGATGPCGPCSEVHYDRIGNRDAAHLVNADVADVMEIWNLVFMQFNRESETVFKLLPDKHVDTGMGLERIASILQDKTSNYDTDIFVPIFELIQECCGCKPYAGKIGAEDTDLTDMAYRVVADHIRTVTFAITDGCVPSSDGRGYVIRRILRRAVRYGQEILHAPAGFFTKLVPQVVTMMDSAFPGMAAKQAYVMGVVEDEEKSFVRTLDQGVKHFQKVVAQLTAEGKTEVSGKDAHLLFGSMGFPFDLTQLMAEEKGLTVNSQEFDELMEKDRQISVIAHSAKKIVGTRNFSMAAEQTSWLADKGVEGTDSSSKYVWQSTTAAEIKAVYLGLGNEGAGFTPVVECTEDDTFGVILNATSYYYESGGQINDVGTLQVTGEGGEKFTLQVLDCKAYGPYVLHVCSGLESVGKSVKTGLKVTCHVDYDNRSFVAPNHTMTHSLNYALRKVLLGDNCEISAKGSVDQKGSLVDADKLRFDFGWGTALTSDELMAVESMVNEVIRSNLTVFAENVPLAEAKAICSLRSVFGERYPDPVRVLSVGVDVKDLISNPDNSEWYKYSVEFCGGTHLSNTNEAEEFIIIEESGISKGIRRIFGLTRKAAREARARAAALMSRLEQLQQMAPGPELSALSKKMQLEIDQVVASLSDKDQLRKAQAVVNNSLKAYNKEVLATRKATAIAYSEQAGKDAAESNTSVVISVVDFGADGKIAKTMQDIIKKHSPSTSNFFCSLDATETKVGVYTVATADHVKAGLDAKEWSNHVIKVVGGGKGGGKSSQATASIPVDDNHTPEEMVDAILTAAREFASAKGF